MIVLTGAGGFIGSVILGYLNSQGFKDIIIIDNLGSDNRFMMLNNKRFYRLYMPNEDFDTSNITAVIHCGANSNTLEKDWNSLYETNVRSTRQWHDLCLENNIPFIFLSSAALYGNNDGPLNLYAFSKQVSENEIQKGVILRLFNVYGPNEYHKGRMASTIYHWHKQIQETGTLKIFENSDKYTRDFVYVEDVARVVAFFLSNYQPGVYDVGSGGSASFETVADIIIQEAGEGKKEYIVMPSDLKSQYQTTTKSNIVPLKNAGFNVNKFRNIEQGIKDYVKYLKFNDYY